MNAELLGIAVAACAVCTIDGKVIGCALHDVICNVGDVTAPFVA